MARVFRSTFDQLYDGQRTGRYRLDQLFKTEKTHFGTLIEINLQRELRLQDVKILDFTIAGHEVDCKYSHTSQWMLPIESFDQIALVTQANDTTSTWSAIGGEVAIRNLVCDTAAVNSEFQPRLLCPGRPEIWSSMLARATDYGRSNAVGSTNPCIGSTPAARRHQGLEHLPHGGRRSHRTRPLE